MLEDSFKARLSDYFTAGELLDLLEVSIDDVLYSFEDILYDNQDLLEDYMAHGR